MFRFALFVALLVCRIVVFNEANGLYSLSSKVVTECELEALTTGTRLADRYGSYDEQTEWDVRIHNEYLAEHLGFAGWIQMGKWPHTKQTAEGFSAPDLHRRGGWAGSKNVSQSAYWALQNKWLYLMGDSTQRQIWATFVSPFQNNDFERNAKEWTRENCERQYPHRKKHPADHYFPEEGWGGRCGNNEVTCHLSGFGPDGIISFDWKHFPWEDYDQWLFGPTGRWNGTSRSPDILVIQVGLHTCHHATPPSTNSVNTSMIRAHEADLHTMMKAIRDAVNRAPPGERKTTVIIQTPGRQGGSDPVQDHCNRRFNRIAALEAHTYGFAVLDRSEIERRLLFKYEYWEGFVMLKNQLHLENPAPNVVGTSLLSLISCLERNGTDRNTEFQPVDVP